MINFKQPHEILNQFKQYENPYDFSNEKIMVRFDDAIKAMVEYSDQFKHLHKPVVMQGLPNCPKCGKIDWIYSTKNEYLKCLTCWEAARSVGKAGEDATLSPFPYAD